MLCARAWTLLGTAGLLLGLLWPHSVAAQADEVLQARKVSRKINIRYLPVKGGRMEYVIDDDYRNPDSKRLSSPMSVVATDESFKILTRFVNPLNYTVRVTQSSITDTEIEKANEFLASLTQLFGQMGATQFIKASTVEKVRVDKILSEVRSGDKQNFKVADNYLTEADRGKAADGAQQAASNTFAKSVTGRLRSQEALSLSLWLYGVDVTKKDAYIGCFEANYRDEILANMVAIEDRLYAFPDSARLLVQQMIAPQTYQALLKAQPTYEALLKKLKQNDNVVTQSLGLLSKTARPEPKIVLVDKETRGTDLTPSRFITDLEKYGNTRVVADNNVVSAVKATSTSTPLSYCDNLKLYTSNLLDNYTQRVTAQLKIRQALLAQFDSMIKQIQEEMDEADKNRLDDDYFVEKGYVESEPGKITTVDIHVVQNNVQFQTDNSTITITKQELLSSSLKVRPYSTLVAEAGVGVAFANLIFPKYAVATINNRQEVVGAGADRVSIIPMTVLNIYPAAFKSSIYPLLQLGMGTGQGRPTLFFGTGLRFLRPFNRVTITGGAVWTWRRELNDLAIGSEVTGPADVEKDLTYHFRDIPRPYLGIQYNF
jgi:hypothetical protein